MRFFLKPLLWVSFFILINNVIGQNCQTSVQILPTNPTACGVNNGSIQVTEYGASPSFYEWSLNGTTWFQAEATQSNLAAGFYVVRIRDKATQVLCRSTTIELHPINSAPFTGVTVNDASSCKNSNGQITLLGVVSTDSVSWISKIKRTYVRISTLVGGNKINGLLPGTYYVRVKKAGAGNTFCYTDRTVVVGPACAPAALCPSTTTNLFTNGDFGAGTPVNGTPLSTTETQYGNTNMTCSAPDDGLYAVVNTTNCNGLGGQVFNTWDLTEDHTTGDVGGYMMLVNASFNPDIVIEKNISGLCPNTEYEFSAFVRNVYPTGPILPNLTFLLDGIGKYSTGDITGSAWVEVGFRFTTGGSQTTASFSIRNNAPGGNGNDWAIDDIFVGLCIPDITITPPLLRKVCLAAASETISATVTDPRQQFDAWRWQESTDGGTTWAFIGTATTSTFNASNQYVASFTLAGPLGATYNNRKYRLRVASTTGNLSSTTCSYVSPTAVITLQIITPPTATATITGPACTNGSLKLNASSSVASSSFAWSGPNSYTSSQQNPTIVLPALAASGNYIVTVTEPTGTCSTTATVAATVSTPPNATAGNNGPICPGTNLNLTATGGGTYSWMGPLNFTSTQQNPVIPVFTSAYAGTYTVTVTSAAGCVASANTTVVVSASPNKPGGISY